jgi:hypothetical protein
MGISIEGDSLILVPESEPLRRVAWNLVNLVCFARPAAQIQHLPPRQHLFHRMPSVLAFCWTADMALETLGHMPRAMGAAAFRHHMTHDIVIHYRRSRTEGRSKLMARGARMGTCHDENKFSMRVHHGARGDLRESASMLGMTGQTSLLVSNDIQMEGSCRRHRAFCKARLRVA